MYQRETDGRPSAIRMGASGCNMNPETQLTIDIAKSSLETLSDIMNSVERGEATYSSACSKHGIQYMRFKYFVTRLASFGGQNEREIHVPPFEPTPAEMLYANVFGIDVHHVNEMMPDDAEEMVERVLATLAPREVEVLRMRLDGATLDKVADEFNVTRERIRQVEAKAIRKLRHPPRSRLLMFGEDTINHEQTEFEHEKSELLEKYRQKLRLNDAEYQMSKNGIEQLDAKAAEREEANRPKRLDEITLEDMDLSVRSFNCCRRAGIYTVADFAKYDIDRLMKIRNLGRKSLEEILKKLKQYGVKIEGCEDGAER